MFSSRLGIAASHSQAQPRCVAPHKNLPVLLVMLVLGGGNCVAIVAGVCDGFEERPDEELWGALVSALALASGKSGKN